MGITQKIIGAVIAAAGSMASLNATAQDPAMSLRHGVYVSGAARCKGAANADVMSWDGTGFAGAHSSRCTSKISPQQGARFQIDTTCLALGDGTEGATGASATDSFVLTRLSDTRFEVFKEKQAKRTYRWCGAGAPG